MTIKKTIITIQPKKVVGLALFLLLLTPHIKPAIACTDAPELGFLNTVSAVLEIELNNHQELADNHLGKSTTDTQNSALNVTLSPEIYVEETDSFRPLSEAELSQIALNEATVELTSVGNERVIHKAPNGRFFTVKELVEAVELTEKMTRSNSRWFGDIDTHHIFFEGIYCEQGQRVIYWGS